MSEKLSKKEAASLIEVSERWLERHAENEEWQKAVGYERGANNRVKFDAEKFTTYYKDKIKIKNKGNGNKADNTNKADKVKTVVDAEIIPPKENNKLQSQSRNNDLKMLSNALMLPFERVLTLKQARIESGLSEAIIKQGIESGQIKAKRLNPKKIQLKGKDYISGKYQISLISLKKFVVEYLE